MLAVDIAEFTRPDRDDEIQLHLRTCLYGLLREALGRCGMPWDNGQHEDRGDGAVVIFPPDLAAQPIIDAFPDRLQCQVARHNRYSTLEAAARFKAERETNPFLRHR